MAEKIPTYTQFVYYISDHLFFRWILKSESAWDHTMNTKFVVFTRSQTFLIFVMRLLTFFILI